MRPDRCRAVPIIAFFSPRKGVSGVLGEFLVRLHERAVNEFCSVPRALKLAEYGRQDFVELADVESAQFDEGVTHLDHLLCKHVDEAVVDVARLEGGIPFLEQLVVTANQGKVI